jgi:hypothetical protein
VELIVGFPLLVDGGSGLSVPRRAFAGARGCRIGLQRVQRRSREQPDADGEGLLVDVERAPVQVQRRAAAVRAQAGQRDRQHIGEPAEVLPAHALRGEHQVLVADGLDRGVAEQGDGPRVVDHRGYATDVVDVDLGAGRRGDPFDQAPQQGLGVLPCLPVEHPHRAAQLPPLRNGIGRDAGVDRAPDQ